MGPLFFLCLCLAIGVIHNKVSKIPAKEGPVKVVASLFWLAKGDSIAHTSNFENSNYFREHLRDF